MICPMCYGNFLCISCSGTACYLWNLALISLLYWNKDPYSAFTPWEDTFFHLARIMCFLKQQLKQKIVHKQSGFPFGCLFIAILRNHIQVSKVCTAVFKCHYHYIHTNILITGWGWLRYRFSSDSQVLGGTRRHLLYLMPIAQNIQTQSLASEYRWQTIHTADEMRGSASVRRLLAFILVCSWPSFHPYK